MDNEKDDVKGFVDIFDDDAIVTLMDDDENPTDFYEIASVEYNDKFYEILQPVKPMEGLEDGEALIFEYDIDEVNDEKKFKLVYDEEILETVFELYLRAEADMEYEDDGEDEDEDGHCGCGCHGCKSSCGSCGDDDETDGE